MRRIIKILNKIRESRLIDKYIRKAQKDLIDANDLHEIKRLKGYIAGLQDRKKNL